MKSPGVTGFLSCPSGPGRPSALLIPLQLACLCLLPLLCPLIRAAHPTFNNDPEYLIDRWETEDGLPENSATAMVQTPDGYLWFGTFNGLVRFDGVKFTVFDSVNTPQLPSSGIVNLHLDRRGWLWVSTFRGVVVRQGTQWRTWGTNDGWAGDLVRTFAERSNGDLLMTTFDGHVLEFAQGRLKELPAPRGHPGVGYLGFADETDRWWVVQQWFVGSYDGHQWIEAEGVTNLLARINGAGAARDGGIWLKAGSGLYKVRQGKQVARIELPNRTGTPWSITEDSHTNVWIATYDQGLMQVTSKGEVRQWTATNGLTYNSTRFVFEDREHNSWVGTSGGGLLRFKSRRFQSYGTDSGLTDRNVTSVAPDTTGGMWLATYAKGMFRWNGGSLTNVPLPSEQNSLNVVNSVLTDRAGRTWFGTWGQAVCFIDARGFHRIPKEQVGGFNFLSLFEDSRGRIWAGGSSATALGEAEVFRVLPGTEGAPSVKGVRCFAEDRAGVIWASNLEGLFRYENERFAEVRENGQSLRDVSCIKTDADGTVWLGLLRGGLLCWRGGAFTQIDLGLGQPPGIHGLLEDDAGFFWMPSNRGVLRAARKSLLAAANGNARAECLRLDLSDGLPSVECSGSRQPTCARDSAGRLWFATMKGAAMIDPTRFALNTNPPPVEIESVIYHTSSDRAASANSRARGDNASESETVRNGPFAGRLILPAGSRRVEVHYTALSFVAPDRVRFQVKLDGRDTGWHEVGNQRVELFHDVPPGDYTFRVRAANNDGVWNETGASLALTVQPFYWETLWFRIGAWALLIAVGAASAWWLIRDRQRRELAELQRTQRQQAELAHVARVSTMGELAASVAHELNQPLGAILSNAEAAELFLNQNPPALGELRDILADIRKDDERAGEVIRRMRTLLRKREMEMQTLELNSAVDDVFRLVSADAALRKTAIVAELSPWLPAVRGDRVHLQQVLLNLIMNAMEAMDKQPPEQRRLVVRTSHNGNGAVEVTVTDSGPGLEPDKLARLFDPFFTTKPNGLGMGLSISRKIIEVHHGRIWAENQAAGGAAFRFTLPIATEALKS
jgi:signal transduction histidine kinase